MGSRDRERERERKRSKEENRIKILPIVVFHLVRSVYDRLLYEFI